MTVERPVLRYFGGKWMLAPWIIDFFPPHEIYVEPFGGAASVLVRKPRAKVEIYNDIDREIVNVFRVLRSTALAEDLRRRLELTPYARDEYYAAFEPADFDSVEQARRTIVRAFMGHGPDSVNGHRRSGFRAKTIDSNRCSALDWVNYAPAVTAFSTRLAGVAVENRDAMKLIPSFDSPRTLFYVDPPYVHSTRGDRHNYRHEMTDDCHRQLLEVLRTVRGMVVLSGYRNDLYESLGWTCHQTQAFADGSRPRTECLWLNPSAERFQSQQELPIHRKENQ